MLDVAPVDVAAAAAAAVVVVVVVVVVVAVAVAVVVVVVVVVAVVVEEVAVAGSLPFAVHSFTIDLEKQSKHRQWSWHSRHTKRFDVSTISHALRSVQFSSVVSTDVRIL